EDLRCSSPGATALARDPPLAPDHGGELVGPAAGGSLSAVRPATLATIVTSSLGSTGLGTCMLKPAMSETIRSCARPYAVSATAGVLPPCSEPSARTLRIKE